MQTGLVVLALVLLAACTTTAPPPSPPEAEQAEPLPAAVPIAPAEPVQRAPIRISIAAVGDMMLGTDYPENHLPDDDGVGFLAGVTPWLWSADVTFGNLEGVLVDGGEPGKKCSNPKACYLFRSPSRYAYHYRAAGFDVLSLANNHARDFGEEGRSATMQTLAAAGMHHSGREGDFASFEVKGLRLAMLAYAVTRNSNMLLDYARSEQTVRDYAATHDIVVVSFHGGAEGRDVTRLPFAEEEYYGEPRGDVVRFARMVVDAGADLVIGHGPHVVRAMERYKDRLIAYSLGNFATYYGISVTGIKGIAPILIATLDEEGRFVEGDIISTRQLRPAGPSLDPDRRALKMIRGLSSEDFGNPGLTFHPDGRLTPTDRPPVARRMFDDD
jgi:poly-gamma-glutamate capsule biosynthesis protein CapA/YwtB (metallophosphatase superfamily)